MLGDTKDNYPVHQNEHFAPILSFNSTSLSYVTLRYLSFALFTPSLMLYNLFHGTLLERKESLII